MKKNNRFFRFLLPAIYGGVYSKNGPFSIHFSLCSIFYPGSCCKKCCNYSKEWFHLVLMLPNQAFSAAVAIQ